MTWLPFVLKIPYNPNHSSSYMIVEYGKFWMFACFMFISVTEYFKSTGFFCGFCTLVIYARLSAMVKRRMFAVLVMDCLKVLMKINLTIMTVGCLLCSLYYAPCNQSSSTLHQ